MATLVPWGEGKVKVGNWAEGKAEERASIFYAFLPSPLVRVPLSHSIWKAKPRRSSWEHHSSSFFLCSAPIPDACWFHSFLFFRIEREGWAFSILTNNYEWELLFLRESKVKFGLNQEKPLIRRAQFKQESAGIEQSQFLGRFVDPLIKTKEAFRYKKRERQKKAIQARIQRKQAQQKKMAELNKK